MKPSKPAPKKRPRRPLLDRRSLASLVVISMLGAGFVITTRFAGAETGSSLEEGDLATLLEAKLGHGESTPPAPRSSSPELDALTSATNQGPIDVATRMAGGALLVAGIIFIVAMLIKRSRESRMGEDLGSNLVVKDSVWIGRGQRILLVTFEGHKVLVGVTNGALHGLGVFGEDGTPSLDSNPIERDAAMRTAETRKTSEFADFVKGELATNLAANRGTGVDRRRKMLNELNSL
ncbi:MAG: flagellar biosynthetic protein FliO [Myxococcota bacterium]